ncbi:predicted protein [Naegleria gruberi]|uniref:Predicted protein n=1 Tax=Naegleria gruberi TaxID=5762 RepID=D2V2J5_NAEGR|nr:uncharacterized protein NAEGRDRAFT_63021 [Naegleria gruberi]EFC49070.1 predicted protein [Naegleria gruberi]|eukprot:XP_002681814.1 predicted protein [Naegleria gruberi strain NEG-M]
MTDTEDEENSEISSISTGLSDSPNGASQLDFNTEDPSSPQPIQKLVYNLDDSIDQEVQADDDLQILIPRAKVVLKYALDDVTKEKNDLEEQFVTQVEELEKFLTRSQRPYVKKGRRSLSKHLSDEELSSVNSTLRKDIPSAEDSPIVKLSQSLLNSTPKKFPVLNMTSSEKDSVIYSLREKIEEIKYRYENERATESLRESLTSEISSLLQKLTIESDGSQTERTRNLTSSLKSFLDSSSLSITPKESRIVKEMRIKQEIQKGIIEQLKVENEKLKEKLESERKSRKIVSKELTQSENYILRLEEQMQKRDMQNNDKLSILTGAYDDLVSENSELIQQVKFMREQLLDSQSNTNLSVLAGRSNKNKLTSSNILSMISDTQSVSSLSTSRNDEPVQDIKY